MDNRLRPRAPQVARIASLVTAWILCSAAVLKTWDLGHNPSLKHLILESRAVTWLVILGELVLAAWLLAGYRRRLANGFCAFLFACFALIQIFYLVNGWESCACFGSLAVPPAMMLVLDFAIALLLAWTAPYWNSIDNHATNYVHPSLVLFLLPFLFFVGSPPRTTSQIDVTNVGDEIIVLEPSKWVGQPLPIAAYLNKRADIIDGRWRVLLVRPNCNHCRKMILHSLGDDETGFFAVISLSPLQSDSFEEFNGTDIHWLDLDSTRRTSRSLRKAYALTCDPCPKTIWRGKEKLERPDDSSRVGISLK